MGEMSRIKRAWLAIKLWFENPYISIDKCHVCRRKFLCFDVGRSFCSLDCEALYQNSVDWDEQEPPSVFDGWF